MVLEGLIDFYDIDPYKKSIHLHLIYPILQLVFPYLYSYCYQQYFVSNQAYYLLPQVSDVDKAEIDHIWDTSKLCVELTRGGERCYYILFF